ncbi:YfhO family protein [Mammaliicoccus sp. Dog046]|uniref:YfhO family protein n=1 Tax=Mammaliicoccus sp. Dog046 TaxID=3034233 RepID=UPI002B25B564|nr:YfhO family protein [Mammaliicoccus sp. Dog046]WQK84567.1 YfhO family protein [Mammaliicoccus sp. Dog046]
MSHKIKHIIYLLIIAVATAFLFYTPALYRYFIHGDLYTSVGDGLKQMIPFQMYLAEHAKQFTMFYDIGFGIGGDYFSNLSYYYSTSPFAWIGIGFTLLYQSITHAEQLFNIVLTSQLFIAIFKCACTIVVTYLLFLNFKMRKSYAFAGAMLYACSTVFYYFTFTWSFFSDVMFYLPLSILGIERLFKQKKITVLILAIAVTITSNFYFTYYEFIILACYALYRIIFKYKSDILNIKQKLVYLVLCGMIGFLIGNFGFVQGVLSFIDNDRTLTNNHVSPLIPFIKQYNMLYGGFYITVSFLAMIALFLKPLYKFYYFKLFAIFTILTLIGSFSPYFDSFFNGFSMPQRRWVYALALLSAGLTSMVLQHIRLITMRQLLYASIIPVLFIIISAIWQQSFYFWVLFIPIVIGLLMMSIKHHYKYMNIALCLIMVAYQFTLIHDYQKHVLTKYTPNINTIEKRLIYNPKMASKINHLKDQQTDDFRRIDMVKPISVNSPMYYSFNGTKLYSSIYNAEILRFYEKDLLISMPRNSNSYYASFSERTNLNSLFNVDYTIKAKNDLHYPALSHRIDSFKDQGEHFHIYENTQKLPSARIVQNVYHDKDLKSPLEKEHAMLKGIITNDQPSNAKVSKPENLLKSADVQYENASYDNKKLTVHKNGGGLNITLPKDTYKKYQSLYLGLDTEIQKPKNKNYYVAVNENKIFRYRLTYPYVRPHHTTVANVKSSNNVYIKLRKGTYKFDLKSIYGEDFSTLKQASKGFKSQNIKFKNKNTHYEIDLNEHPSGNLVMPLVYKKGLKASIDGKEVPIKKANYIMSSLKVHKDDKKVIISYEPPYLKISMLATFIGIVLLIWLRRNKWLTKQ